MEFNFIDSPSKSSIVRSFEELYFLRVLCDRGQLNKIGRFLTELPMDQKHALVVLNSAKYYVINEILTLVGMLFYRDDMYLFLLTNNSKYLRRFTANGDHFLYIKMFREWKHKTLNMKTVLLNTINIKIFNEAEKIKKQIYWILMRYGTLNELKTFKYLLLLKCILTGFFNYIAWRKYDKIYKKIVSRYLIFVHPCSLIFKNCSDFIVYDDIIRTSKEFIKTITKLNKNLYNPLKRKYI